MQDREALARLVEPRLRPYADAGALRRLGQAERRLVESGFLYVREPNPRAPSGAVREIDSANNPTV